MQPWTDGPMTIGLASLPEESYGPGVMCRGRNGRSRGNPILTSCCTCTSHGWLDCGLCINGLHRLFLMKKRRFHNDIDWKNPEVKWKCLVLTTCTVPILF
ncbi:unnamed protein product [Caretta caretta]